MNDLRALLAPVTAACAVVLLVVYSLSNGDSGHIPVQVGMQALGALALFERALSWLDDESKGRSPALRQRAQVVEHLRSVEMGTTADSDASRPPIPS